MATLRYKHITQGERFGILVPLDIAFADKKDIEACGLTFEEAAHAIGATTKNPMGISFFDMDCVTTTSDGIMTDGATVFMAAADRGIINREFGMLAMEEIPYSDEIVAEEPHLRQWQVNFPGKRLFRGPDPKKKLVPVHNVVITGRASNNNSATEMMNIVTMEEILLPILGQLSIMKGEKILVGMTGGVISVGIGMTVAEKFGRVFPSRQYHAGETAHGCGEYAKTLKEHIPCIVADKSVLAREIIRALRCGMVPGRDIGCSPAVLCVASALGTPIALDRITAGARAELHSIGIDVDTLSLPRMTEEEILSHADEVIPGVDSPQRIDSSDLAEEVSVRV